jgi:hypothetical protein
MATPQGIRAGRAFVELFADDSQLVRGLKSAERRLKAFGAGVRSIGVQLFALGAGVAAPLAAATNVFADMGDKLAKMSVRTGISVEALSELGYAAEQSGADLDSLEVGVRKMQKFLFEASKGSRAAGATLSKLGLQFADLNGLSPDQQLALVADRLANVQDPALKAALAMEIFGKSGTSLLPLMQDGAKGIEELRQQARDLGLTISTEDAKAAETFGDRLSDLWKVIKSGVFAVGAALAPLLQDLAIRATRIVKVTADWVRQNKNLIVTVFKVAVGVAAGGAALIALGTIISGIGAAFGIAASVITGVGTALGVIGTIVGALLSPIGLVAAAVVGLGAYLLYVSGTGGHALAWLGGKFNALKEMAVQAWGGIADALAAGDLALAARILWLTLKMEWQKGVNTLNQVWVKVKTFFLSVWTDAAFGAAKIATNAWATLQAGWTETVDFLADAWSVFTTGLTKTWNTAVGFIRKAWVRLKSLFDSDLDAEAEITRINEEVAGKNQGADDERDRRIVDRDQARRRRLAEIEGGRSGVLDELDQMREAEHAARQARNESDLQASEAALNQARKEWQAAIAEAARKRSEAESEAGPVGPKTADDPLGDLQERVASARNIDFGLTQAQKQAIQLQALGVGAGAQAHEEQTAKNTQQMIAELKAQNKTLRDLLAQQKRSVPPRVATIG